MKTKAVGLALLVWGPWAMAQGLGAPGWNVPQGRWWDRPAIAEALGLTPEQKGKLERITGDHLKALIDARAAVEKAQVDLRMASEKEPFDPQKAREAFAVVQEARRRLEAERFELLLAVRQVLTSEQWHKAQSLARERPQAPQGRRERAHRPGGPTVPPGAERF